MSDDLNDGGGEKSDDFSKRTSSRLRTELLSDEVRARLDEARGRTSEKRILLRPPSRVEDADDEVGVTSRGFDAS